MSALSDVHAAMMRIPHDIYCRKLLSIVTEKENVCKLNPIPTQMKIIETMKRQAGNKRMGGRIRLFILKARRVRATTIATSWGFHKYAHNPNCSVELTGDVMKQSQYMLGMMKHYYRNYGVPGFLPPLSVDNNDEMMLSGWSENCSIRISSADNPDKVCRGQRVSVWLATEFPLYHSPKELYQAAYPAVKDGHIILEGTGNGKNESFDIWEAAGRGDIDLEQMFIPWYEFPEYRLPVREMIARYDSEEVTLRRLCRVDDEQILWRRKMIAELGSLTAFHHEHPAFDHEAWESSSASYFDQIVVSENIASAKKAEAVGLLEEVKGGITFRTGRGLPLSVWEMPKPGLKYLISADIAGARTGLKRDNDASAAHVYQLNPFKQVASLTYRVEELTFAADLWRLSRFYNRAMIAPERNNTGAPVIQWLKEHDANLWEMEYNNKWATEYAGFPGWMTTPKTRPQMLAELRQFVKESPSVFVDPQFWSECNTFVYRNGRYEADAGRHDDHVFAAAIAVQVYKSIKDCGPASTTADAPVENTDGYSTNDIRRALRQPPRYIYDADGKRKMCALMEGFTPPACDTTLAEERVA